MNAQSATSVRSRLGLVLLPLGVALAVLGSIQPVRWYRQARKPVKPVIARVPIAPGATSAQLALHVAEAGVYTFNIAVDDNNAAPAEDSPRVNCLLGGLRDEGDPTIGCAQYGKPVHLTWQLHDATGSEFARGIWPTGPSGGSLDQEDRKREIQDFAAPTLAPGDYKLDVGGIDLPPYLLSLNPGIESVYENDHYDYQKDWDDLFNTIASAALAVLGLILAIAGIVLFTTSRRVEPS